MYLCLRVVISLYFPIHPTLEADWYLGMNLNPDDNHIMDYLTGWDDGYDIGTPCTAFSKDYLSSVVWNMSVNSIAIVRHQKVGKKEDALI